MNHSMNLPDTQANSAHLDSFNDVLDAERKALHLDTSKPGTIRGLALSGGGIRSASFGLGVVQALARKGLLKQIHYLSTVSGGGYLGAALTWLRRGGDVEQQILATRKGARCANNHPENTWLDFIRQHGNYLLPGSISPLALVGVALRGMAVSLAVYFGLLIGVLALLDLAGVLTSGSVSLVHLHSTAIAIDAISLTITLICCFLVGAVGYSQATYIATFPLGSSRAALASAGALTLFLVFGVAAYRLNVPDMDTSLLRTRQGLLAGSAAVSAFGLALLVFTGTRLVQRVLGQPLQQSSWYYAMRVKLQQWMGGIIGLMIAFTVLATLRPTTNLLDNAVHRTGLGATMSVLGAIGGVYQSLTAGRGKTTNRGMDDHLILIVCSALLIFGMLILGDVVQRAWFVLPSQAVQWAALLAVVVYIGLITNLNLFSIGRMYRDRLMEAFQPEQANVESNRWGEATDADSADLRAAWPGNCGTRCLLPLINCTAVLVDSPHDKYRSRGGDSFTMSPLHCGGDATGWVNTDHFADGHMSLATATATSAAAANPDAAVAGQGLTRNRLVSFLMYVFQIRLGIWVLNPRHHARNGRKLNLTQRFLGLFGQRPNFLFPGINNGLWGRGLSEDSTYIELTDGGHFENTAMYELFRRRVDLIIASDAGADPTYTLSDLANALEKARVDFGINYTFYNDFGSDALRPQKVGSDDLAWAERGYAIARLDYPDRDDPTDRSKVTHGWLLYLQATPARPSKEELALPTREFALGDDTVSFYRTNPLFPNQSTADQFFDERQIEAYRELGYTNTKQALDELGLWREQSGPPATMPPAREKIRQLLQ